MFMQCFIDSLGYTFIHVILSQLYSMYFSFSAWLHSIPIPPHTEMHSRGQVLKKWTGHFQIGLFEFSLPVLLPFGERKCKGRGCHSLGVQYSIRIWPFGASGMSYMRFAVMFTEQNSLGVCSVFTRCWPRWWLPVLCGMWKWSVSCSYLGGREVLSSREGELPWWESSIQNH